MRGDHGRFREASRDMKRTVEYRLPGNREALEGPGAEGGLVRPQARDVHRAHPGGEPVHRLGTIRRERRARGRAVILGDVGARVDRAPLAHHMGEASDRPEVVVVDGAREKPVARQAVAVAGRLDEIDAVFQLLSRLGGHLVARVAEHAEGGRGMLDETRKGQCDRVVGRYAAPASRDTRTFDHAGIRGVARGDVADCIQFQYAVSGCHPGADRRPRNGAGPQSVTPPMELTGEYHLPGAREAVWRALGKRSAGGPGLNGRGTGLG